MGNFCKMGVGPSEIMYLMYIKRKWKIILNRFGQTKIVIKDF